MDEAKRIKNLPPYIFARIDKKIAEERAKGVDVISLGMGDPDLPTPNHIIERLNQAARKPANHRYPAPFAGTLEFRQAVADWYKGRFRVDLDAKTEVLALIGTKEGIAHINFCYIDPGDYALIPDPGYPVYASSVLLAGGIPYKMPLREENGFLPDLEAIPEEIARKAKLMFINYPNNPTGAVAEADFYRKVIAFAQTYDILVCHDAPYSEIAFDGYKPLSFLEFPGAKEVGVEFHSMSKTFNMTGWRIGWVAGNERAVEALARIKSNIDSGVFQAIQEASIEGLRGSMAFVRDHCKIYQERRDIVVDTLNSMGWQLEKPKAAIYIWPRVPKGYTSESFAALVIEKSGVVVTAGNAYGEYGEGYFRISLTIGTERLREALARIKENVGKMEF
ncbi:MAG: LL-diaminopimelate aminotransferase [Peptococcaceae bacterium]|jgi:LL-diaminopimelate aminotransferase|nr:LL-diaminopimelate aminotransferase [Peptococcaceae bacterium]